MPAAAIAGAAAPIAGGIIGNLAAGGDQDQAGADMQAALAAINGVQVPTISEQQWNLAQEQNQGALSPEALQTLGMGPNALSGIQTNPQFTSAQMDALNQLGQLGQGGLTAQEKQNLIQANLAASGQAQSQNAAIQQAMAARGMGGSGVQLAAQLSNSQNSANMLSNQSNSLNAMAQQNALQAIAQRASLGGQAQAQQFGQQAAVAQAQNAINQYNSMNAQNVASYNTQAQNQAQANNLANQQNIANTNVGLTNQQTAHNTGLYQQQYADQMQKAAALAGADYQNANYMGNQANQTRGMWAGIGSGVGSAANAYGMGQAMGGMGGSSSSPSSSGSYMPSSQDWSNMMGGPGSNANLGATQATQFGGANAGWAYGGVIPNYYGGGSVEDQVNSGDETGPQIVWSEEALPEKKEETKPKKPTKENYSGGGDVIGLSGHAGKIPLPNSNQVHRQGYTDGGTVGGKIGYPNSDAIIPGVGKTSDALALAAGMARQPVQSKPPVAVAPGEPMDPETAAEYGQEATKYQPIGDISQALAKLAADQHIRQRLQQVPQAAPATFPAIDPSELGAKAYSYGGKINLEMRGGGHVPGKAPVSGDSPKNDVVNAKLSPGEIVVPRSVVNKADEDILNFIKKVREKK